MIRSIDSLTSTYLRDIENAPQDPVLAQLLIDKVQHDLIPIRQNLNNQKSSKQFELVEDKLNDLTYKLDILKYHNKKRLQEITPIREEPVQVSEDESNVKTGTYSTGVKTSDINELRKRLFDNHESTLSNDHHENIQQDLIQDLSDLASDLKNGALNLSMKILDDNNLLSRTQENMMKNDSLMNVVGKNLNSYVLNKTGGKISFWFLIKTVIGILITFFIMVLIINFLPKL